ncbi:MAG: HAMP domain-containing histidine kinase [Planctomycetota bacterium]|jgi:K+-sensing histidine kinase KdpD|nr:HAMP domain-containing histidine kinase [Planctomycetota bacterium]
MDGEKSDPRKSVGGFPGGGNSEETVRELTRRQNELSEAMQRLLRFQRQTLALKNAQSTEAAFDIMESLLIEVVDFAYATLQTRDEEGSFSPVREILPKQLVLDYSLMDWVIGTQEVSVLPIELAAGGIEVRSLLFLPLGSSHIMLLWLEQGAEAFNQEQEALLSVLSREMAAVLEERHFRTRLDKTRIAMSDIIESVPLGLLSLDGQNRIEMINSTAEIALDVRRGDALGKYYADVLSGKLAELLGKMFAEDVRDETELVQTMPSGMEQYLGVTVSPMHGGEGSSSASGKVVVCRDLQLSREVKRLRDLDAMKNDFLSLVSHELRTPLTSIMAYSETLLMDDNDSVPREWREYIDIIHREGQRLSRLIDDILDLTKMEAGKMSYNFELHDPNEIIGAAVMTFMPLLEGKSHHLELDLAEDLGECRLDSDRFTQVANNILSNAIKYTDPGGEIAVRTYRADPLPGSAAPSLVFEVDDSGVGISKENLDKVFSKFEMVEAIKNHTAGTGLGMAICKQIVEDGHSGRIWLESETGVGTKVFVRIPMR